MLLYRTYIYQRFMEEFIFFSIFKSITCISYKLISVKYQIFLERKHQQRFIRCYPRTLSACIVYDCNKCVFQFEVRFNFRCMMYVLNWLLLSCYHMKIMSSHRRVCVSRVFLAIRHFDILIVHISSDEQFYSYKNIFTKLWLC